MNNIPFFSISIPTHGYKGKGSDFLKHNLNILLNQTFNNFEVIISDNSDDDDYTIENIISEYRDKLDIVYTRNQKNKDRISPNLNNAINHCRGKYIKILFMDDFLYNENSLLNQYNELNGGDIKWMITTFCHSNDGKSFYRIYNPIFQKNIWTGNNTLGNPSNLTIKNEDIIFFDESLNWLLDCEYYYRLFLKYGEPHILKEITVVNRTHGGGTSDNTPNEVKHNELIKLKEIYE